MKFSDDQLDQMKQVLETVVPPIVERIVEEKLEQKLEVKLNPIRKDIQFLKKEARYQRKTSDLIITAFEQADQKVIVRLDRLEHRAGISS